MFEEEEEEEEEKRREKVRRREREGAGGMLHFSLTTQHTNAVGQKSPISVFLHSFLTSLMNALFYAFMSEKRRLIF